MRAISHRAIVSGGASSVGKMVSINPATHAYAVTTPNTASWPRRGVVSDVPDALGLQEVVISGSFDAPVGCMPSQWLVVTAGGVLAGVDTPSDQDDIAGYIDADGIARIGKLGAGREVIEGDQWERQCVTMNPPELPTYLYWDVAPQTIAYHVLLQPVGVSPRVLVKNTPAYQTENTFTPYLPVRYSPGTSYVQLINSNSTHQGTSVVYDAQLVR